MQFTEISSFICKIDDTHFWYSDQMDKSPLIGFIRIFFLIELWILFGNAK